MRKTNDLLEMTVRRQSRDTEEPDTSRPIGIVLDSNKPGKIMIQGHFTRGNLEYLSTAI
ncbi:MAG: hypothetical protein ACLFR1_13655 [Spirochaetia bacterium]